MLKLGSLVAQPRFTHTVRAASHSNRRFSSLQGPEPTIPSPRTSCYTLPSGDTIPSVGLGTWRASGEEVDKAVKAALNAGYRHIDCAWEYGNEGTIGNAIQRSGVRRQDIWLTSKLWNAFHSPNDVEAALDETLSRLGTSYLDMYLIHWPVAILKEPYLTSGRFVVDKPLSDDMYPTWKKLEELVDKGKIRNIGVCNFTIWRFEQLVKNPLKYRPLVNQVELNYWNPQPHLVAWAKSRKVLLEASSPFGGMWKVKETLELPIFAEAARQLNITPAQTALSWLRQRGVVVLPKSTHPGRIEENVKAVTLPQELFEKIERAAVSHPPKRMINPSGKWGFNFDIFGLT